MSSSEEAPARRKVFFTNEFKRNIRQLARKYRRIKSDIQPILTELSEGGTPGDRIPGPSVEVYKARARNSDSVRGKSGGYRMIYTRSPENTVILVTIYSKTEQSDISPQEIQQVLTAYEDEQQAEESSEGIADQPRNAEQSEPAETKPNEQEQNDKDEAFRE